MKTTATLNALMDKRWVNNVVPNSVKSDPHTAPIIIPMLNNAWNEVMIGFWRCFSTITACEFMATSNIPAETPSRKKTKMSDQTCGTRGIKGTNAQYANAPNNVIRLLPLRMITQPVNGIASSAPMDEPSNTRPTTPSSIPNCSCILGRRE